MWTSFDCFWTRSYFIFTCRIPRATFYMPHFQQFIIYLATSKWTPFILWSRTNLPNIVRSIRSRRTINGAWNSDNSLLPNSNQEILRLIIFLKTGFPWTTIIDFDDNDCWCNELRQTLSLFKIIQIRMNMIMKRKVRIVMIYKNKI